MCILLTNVLIKENALKKDSNTIHNNVPEDLDFFTFSLSFYLLLSFLNDPHPLSPIGKLSLFIRSTTSTFDLVGPELCSPSPWTCNEGFRPVARIHLGPVIV